MININNLLIKIDKRGIELRNRPTGSFLRENSPLMVGNLSADDWLVGWLGVYVVMGVRMGVRVCRRVQINETRTCEALARALVEALVEALARAPEHTNRKQTA